MQIGPVALDKTIGQDFGEYTKEERCSKCSSGLVATPEQVGRMVVVCFHNERAGKEDEIRTL